MYLFRAFILFLTVVVISGCGTHDSNLYPTFNQPQKVHENINSNYKYTTAFKFFDGVEYTDFNKAIIEIAQQLLLNITRSNQINNTIAVTPLVSLDQFAETSRFGRAVSESLINELHERRFKVIDYRVTELIKINPKGEFVLTRDAEKLKSQIPYSLILLGTYGLLELDDEIYYKDHDDKVVINTRIMDLETSNVLSTSRVIVIFKNARCRLFNLCVNKKSFTAGEKIPIKEICEPFENCKKESDKKIHIMDDEISRSKVFNSIYMTDDQ